MASLKKTCIRCYALSIPCSTEKDGHYPCHQCRNAIGSYGTQTRNINAYLTAEFNFLQIPMAFDPTMRRVTIEIDDREHTVLFNTLMEEACVEYGWITPVFIFMRWLTEANLHRELGARCLAREIRRWHRAKSSSSKPSVGPAMLKDTEENVRRTLERVKKVNEQGTGKKENIYEIASQPENRRMLLILGELIDKVDAAQDSWLQKHPESNGYVPAAKNFPWKDKAGDEASLPFAALAINFKKEIGSIRSQGVTFSLPIILVKDVDGKDVSRVVPMTTPTRLQQIPPGTAPRTNPLVQRTVVTDFRSAAADPAAFGEYERTVQQQPPALLSQDFQNLTKNFADIALHGDGDAIP